jgi:hypothetical protein
MTIGERRTPLLTAADIPWELAVAPATTSDDVLVDAVVEAMAYRVLAQQAIHQLHALQGDITRLERERDRLRDEYRSLRERVLRDAGRPR